MNDVLWLLRKSINVKSYCYYCYVCHVLMSEPRKFNFHELILMRSLLNCQNEQKANALWIGPKEEDDSKFRKFSSLYNIDQSFFFWWCQKKQRCEWLDSVSLGKFSWNTIQNGEMNTKCFRFAMYAYIILIYFSR